MVQSPDDARWPLQVPPSLFQALSKPLSLSIGRRIPATLGQGFWQGRLYLGVPALLGLPRGTLVPHHSKASTPLFSRNPTTTPSLRNVGKPLQRPRRECTGWNYVHAHKLSSTPQQHVFVPPQAKHSWVCAMGARWGPCCMLHTHRGPSYLAVYL